MKYINHLFNPNCQHRIIIHVNFDLILATLYCQRENDIILEDENGSKTYFLVNFRLNWTEAECLCWKNYNGTLLSIENGEKQNFVSSVLSREPFVSLVNNQSVWTGLVPVNGEWRWSECKI